MLQPPTRVIAVHRVVGHKIPPRRALRGGLRAVASLVVVAVPVLHSCISSRTSENIVVHPVSIRRVAKSDRVAIRAINHIVRDAVVGRVARKVDNMHVCACTDDVAERVVDPRVVDRVYTINRTATAIEAQVPRIADPAERAVADAVPSNEAIRAVSTTFVREATCVVADIEPLHMKIRAGASLVRETKMQKATRAVA